MISAVGRSWGLWLHNHLVTTVVLRRWGEAPAVWQIEVQEGYTLQELLQALGRLEWQVLHDVKHGQAPAETQDMHEPVEA